MVIFLLVLTVVCWGISPIFDKAALKNADPLAGTMIRGLMVGIFMAAAMFLSGKTREVFSANPKSVAFFAVSGLLAGCLGAFTFYKALQIGPTSKIVPLAATYPLITALLSITFLGESMTISRFAGIALIVAGIWLVK